MTANQTASLRLTLPNWTVVEWSASVWFCIALAGQLAFAAFIFSFYLFPALTGNLLSWNDNVLLKQPPVQPGEWANTLAFGTHAIGAGFVAILGGLQLMPSVRNRFRTFHRLSGRVYIFLVVALSLAGFFLTWVTGPRPAALFEYATSTNGLLIFACAFLAVRAARSKKFRDHERWAIRLFLMSNAQWFLRIGGFGYFLTMQAIGVQVEFDGVFFKFWVWGCFLVPLAFAELYFRTRQQRSLVARAAGTAGIALATIFTTIGTFVFTVFLTQIASGITPA